MGMLRDADQFYLTQSEPAQSCLLALRKIILDQDPNVTETVKYGMPCFCYGKTAFCYLWIDKKTAAPYILFVEGRHLEHTGLEVGDRKRMKILRVDPEQDIPKARIAEVVDQALDFYRKGVVKMQAR